MDVNDALIDNLSNLARLEFNREEKEEIRKDLQRMIQFVEKLGELDTTGVEPLLHMSPEINVLRDDLPQGSVSREQALANAPSTDGTFFKVPKVIRNPSRPKL
ncbi:MAG TPA: Asp-tRNA(Asn)/Glu-tRNA(Gln) amidotransferase subunit GatC [Puia sp.]|nr:Asp-tRNA(Asn)/Glu-tRNA(Gln) amidotransferase subunit GatC [Puia sp.]